MVTKQNIYQNKFHITHQKQHSILETQKKNILLYGCVQPKASIGLNDIMHNRATMSFSGPSVLVLTNLKECYDIDYPNVCVKGLFSGTTEMENSGTSSVKCKVNELSAEFTWDDKREISGKIKK